MQAASRAANDDCTHGYPYFADRQVAMMWLFRIFFAAELG
jgi:hypothetical protein